MVISAKQHAWVLIRLVAVVRGWEWEPEGKRVEGKMMVKTKKEGENC